MFLCNGAFILLVGFLFVSPSLLPLSRADELVGLPVSSDTSPPVANQDTTPARKKKQGKSNRGKEAEGSQAPNRFEVETVVKKSHYELDGQPLEVDPD